MGPEARRVTFHSDGCRVSGLLFLPEAQSSCPGIVMPQGTIGLKEHYRYPELAGILAEHGYAVLIFDYRGFGESDGPKNRIRPLEQVQDILSALTFLGAQTNVNERSLGLLGFCWGGSHSVYVGGIDPRVRCVAEVVGIGDGARWLRSLRRYWEWREFVRRIEADRVQRVTSGSSQVVEMGEVLLGSPMAKEGRRRIKEQIAPASPPYFNPSLTLECADQILAYRPQDVVGRISPRPLLIIHGANDDLAPLEEAEALYEDAGDPKELVVLPDAYHHDVYLDPLFAGVVGRVLNWFQRWLPPHAQSGGVPDNEAPVGAHVATRSNG